MNGEMPLTTRALSRSDSDFALPVPILIALRPTLRLLQIFGIYSSCLPRRALHHRYTTDFTPRSEANCNEEALAETPCLLTSSISIHSVRNGNNSCRSGCFLLLAITYIAACTAIVGLVVYVCQSYIEDMGLWNPETVQSLITGLKPLQSCINLLLLNVRRRQHLQLLYEVNSVDEQIKRLFKSSTNTRTFNRAICACVCFALGITFLLRLAEYLATLLTSEPMDIDSGGGTGTIILQWVFEYVPFVMLPLFSVWQLLPLAYHFMLLWLCRVWIRQLTSAMRKDPELRLHAMSAYLDTFNKIAQVQRSIGRVFGLFIIVNMGLTELTLCLTIYCITQTRIIQQSAETSADAIFIGNIIWSILQILILLLYLLSIGIGGFKTNEKTRSVLQVAVQNMRPRDEETRFQIFCLAERSKAQHSFGISVWPGFLIERGFLFSVIGLTVTYGLVLLRLKPSKPCPLPDSGNITSSFMPNLANITSSFSDEL